MEVVDADILKFTGFSSFAEGFNKYTWCAGNTAKMNMVA
jgi:hypothetical protein